MWLGLFMCAMPTAYKKSPYFRTSSSLKMAVRRGFEPPDTLPYTHFPGVLLQPLGHLTKLFCLPDLIGGNGALL